MSNNKNNLIKRLVLAKKIYLHGCSHAFNKDLVSRMLAIHNFDNAVEIILKCVAEKEKIKPKGKYYNFGDLLKGLKKYPYFKTQIEGLHAQRNLIQHQGDMPDIEVVLKYKNYTEDFFKEICKKEFNILYEELYLSSLIENEDLKKKVLKAEKAFEREQYKECIRLCDDAVIAATFDVGDIFYKAGILTSYWGVDEEFRRVINENYSEKYKETNLYDLAKDLSKAILQGFTASTVMQFLEEYKMDFLSHRRRIENLRILPEGELKNHAQSSLSFIINIILKWQEEGIFNI